MLALALATAVYAWPVLTDIGVIAGRGDYFQFAWNFWWLRESLLNGLNPFFCPLQYYPDGTSLAFHDLTPHWSLLSIPLQSFAAPVTVLNGFILLSFFLTGCAGYMLFRSLGLSRSGSLFGAFAFAFCVHRINRWHHGEVSLLGMMYLPLAVMAARSILAAETPRRLALAAFGLGLAVALSALCSLYNGLYAALLALGFALCSFRSWTPRRLAAMAGAALLCLALLSPLLWAMARDAREGVVALGDLGQALKAASYNGADLLSYVAPDGRTPSFLLVELRRLGLPEVLAWVRSLYAGFHGNLDEKSLYLTLTCMVLAGLGLWRSLFAGRGKYVDESRRPAVDPRAVWAFALLGLFAFVYSLGYEVRFAGEKLFVNPLFEACKVLPLFRGERTPSRMGILTVLAVCFFAALGAERLLASLGPRRWARVGLTLALLLAVGLETFAPGTPRRLPTSRFLSPAILALAEETPGPVLNVPFDRHGARGQADVYLFQQTVHGHPLLGGYVSRLDLRTEAFLNAHPLLQILHHADYGALTARTLADMSDAELAEAFRELPVRWIVLHKRWLDKARAGEWLGRFEAVLGPPAHADDSVRVYRNLDP